MVQVIILGLPGAHVGAPLHVTMVLVGADQCVCPLITTQETATVC